MKITSSKTIRQGFDKINFMDIRKATSEDALLLSTLCMDVQRLHVKHHPEYFKSPRSEDFAESFFKKMLNNDPSVIFIAEEEGSALGYVFCNLIDKPDNPFVFARRFLMVEQISVRPQAQGRGVGALLMGQVEDTARELDVKRIELGSWDFNMSAHGFFERMGYQKRHFEFWKTIT